MSTAADSTPVDPERLEAFMGQFVADMGATAAGASVIVGDRLGLYRALAEVGPATAEQVATQAGGAPRYVREWLSGQAAGGYVSYDPAGEAFSLTPEQAACLVDEDSPTNILGGYELAG